MKHRTFRALGLALVLTVGGIAAPSPAHALDWQQTDCNAYRGSPQVNQQYGWDARLHVWWAPNWDGMYYWTTTQQVEILVPNGADGRPNFVRIYGNLGYQCYDLGAPVGHSFFLAPQDVWGQQFEHRDLWYYPAYNAWNMCEKNGTGCVWVGSGYR